VVRSESTQKVTAVGTAVVVSGAGELSRPLQTTHLCFGCPFGYPQCWALNQG
jgi:hypothetical protein